MYLSDSYILVLDGATEAGSKTTNRKRVNVPTRKNAYNNSLVLIFTFLIGDTIALTLCMKLKCTA